MTNNLPLKNLVKNPERELARLRVVFGCLGGLVLALTAWGIDAYELNQAHSYLPWIKFVLGTIIAIPLYGLAGYLAGRFGMKYFMSFISFAISGYLIAWLAAHLSFDLYNKLIGWINPDLTNRIHFVYDEAARTNLVLTAFVFIVMSAIFAFFYDHLIVQAYSATSVMNVLSALLVTFVFFAASGLLLDYFDNQMQRPPVVQTAVYINQAQAIQAGRITYDPSLMSRERAFLDLGIDLNRDYKLVRISYDPILKFTDIYILFGNDWYECLVVDDQPLNCDANPVTH